MTADVVEMTRSSRVELIFLLRLTAAPATSQTVEPVDVLREGVGEGPAQSRENQEAWTLEEGAADQATGKTLLEDSLREAHLRARRSRHALAEHEQFGKDEVTAPMQSLDEELVELDFFRAERE
jgi:hypothetical protein